MDANPDDKADANAGAFVEALKQAGALQADLIVI